MANKLERQEFMQDSSIIPALPYRIPMPPGAAVPMRSSKPDTNGHAPAERDNASESEN